MRSRGFLSEFNLEEMAAFHRNGRKKESENYYTFTTPRQFCVLGRA